jgi:hypothetical protein
MLDLRAPNPIARSLSSAVLALLLGLVLGVAACQAEVGATQEEELGGARAAPGTVGGASSSSGASGGSVPGASSSGGAPLPTSDIPCNVSEVLARRCKTCHAASPAYGAPMALAALADFHAPAPSNPAKKTYELVRSRTHDTARPMPPPPGAVLDARDQETLDSWIDRGAPASSETSCNPAPGGNAPPVETLPCEPDQELKPTSAYALPAAKADVYVCYGVDIPVAAKRHVIALAPKVDNTKVVHHILLLETAKSVSTTPFVCGPESANAGRILGAWAPGGKNIVLPKEAGFPQQGTMHYMVQLHYNNATAAPNQKDASGYRLCTTNQLRTYDADITAFGGESFVIPPRVTIAMSCAVGVPEGTPPVKVFGAMPHMHKLGMSISTTAYRLGKTPMDLGSMPTWDFNNQAWLPLDATLLPGDSVVTRCKWKNTSNLPVPYGEGTDEEMCYSFTMYYPRIPSLSWNAPAQGATCAPL